MRKVVATLLLVGLVLVACRREPAEEEGTLTVYSGRSEELVGPIIERFGEETGIEVEVRYGDTAEMAAQILEEGDNSPASVFWAQDAGALGALARAGRFARLPDELADRVPERFRSSEGTWLGTSGRARVLAYNDGELDESDLPDSVLDLTDPRWRGRIGWAPTNGSFQAFVTALRKVRGDDAARSWLEDMAANDAREYDGNSAIVKAIAAGEIDAGLVNHYYVLELGAEDPAVRDNVRNHYFPGGDVGSLVNVAGVGILAGAPAPRGAERFVDFLTSREARDYFDEEVYEYPLQTGRSAPEGQPALADIEQPNIDLADLDDLEGTLELLRSTGVL